MAHIMLTYKCNLHCPYCFANEFVNQSATDITMENFKKAVDFLTKRKACSIGLIGGEPTIHPQFEEMLLYILMNPKIKSTTIFTNGVLLDKYMDFLRMPKFGMLINWNSEKDIGTASFNKVRDNVDRMIFEYGMKNQVNIGINLYDPAMDYSYIMEVLERYSIHKLRISLTVPDFSETPDTSALEYFCERKEFLLKFFHDMDSINVLPHYDCNVIPDCIWTAEEREWLKSYVARHAEAGDKTSNLIGNGSFCSPVIDILPDLTAIRCFGMSEFAKANIGDFDSLDDLIRYFSVLIDGAAYKIPGSEKCCHCMRYQTLKCTAGCMGYKAGKIDEINKMCSSCLN